MLSLPGVWYSSITDKVIETCEERGDALGIIDLEGGYIPPHEQYYSDAADRKGSVDTVLTNLDARNLNNSYGATYYPWVLARDTSGAPLRLPPSVPALGVLAKTEAVADVWFAPAGFNRGGLSNSGAGIAVTSVDEVLNSADRDRLYASNVNPIARFPAEGIVVFGQKTLQATPSALDRINVRRLLIFLKKGISRIASGTLFEQNVPATWRRFKNAADDFLSNVKVGFGLDDYRIVLDETTTTPDLVDRNILYAKVFIKPTRSIEFIALDFLITRSGASFDD
jgi:phage tail sheath protein FI